MPLSPDINAFGKYFNKQYCSEFYTEYINIWFIYQIYIDHLLIYILFFHVFNNLQNAYLPLSADTNIFGLISQLKILFTLW